MVNSADLAADPLVLYLLYIVRISISLETRTKWWIVPVKVRLTIDPAVVDNL